ncbi:di-heme oxidoredictase family protein [Amorphus sp. 3PC139-8]|uniref:di-heme oxidoreductase family protein n=1 Tax=Amorphus sp. 3PC139-8 TaxID=2735676 RepID=UPI00345CE7C9
MVDLLKLPARRWVLSGAVAAGVAFAAASGSAGADGGQPEPVSLDALDLPRERTDLSQKDRQRVKAVTAATDDFSKAERFETMSAGAATSRAHVNADSFSHSSANLSFEGEQDFKLGNGLFKKLWVPAPSSTQASDGLGPLYNARSCQRCHLKDGRGHPPDGPDDLATSMFLRLSVPPKTEADREALATKALLFVPDPTYGGQLQDFAVPGLPAEGKMVITYEEVPVELAGGEVVHLRQPSYALGEPGYGPPDPEIMLSPRVAQPMIGLGLLEAIHPADILAHADPDDDDGDGISGKPNLVRDPETAKLTLGRFGWKASMPTVRLQSANAFSGDIGISTPEVPDPSGDCTENQPACLERLSGVQARLGETEAPDPVMELVTFYSKNLAVPARRDVEESEVLKGKSLFYGAGCASCHVPKYVTSREAENPEHRFQLIWPYSDMLLHDMGEGLADNRPVGDADGTEWRTAPLWGIGLTEDVSGHTYFLHDGRARNLTEAILWHGGEAEPARDAFAAMPPDDRAALIRFLESL